MATNEPHARRFEQSLGSAIDSATEADLQRLVDQAVPEDDDLDFRGGRYKDGDELGKDIAAMANIRGGILVVGIAEKNRIAAERVPVDVSDVEERRLHQLAAQWVAPAPTFRIKEVGAAEPGKGYYIVSVPRSANRPHALRREGNLAYPIRRGTTTGWLSESEVASLYRDRFAAAEGALDRLGGVYNKLAGALDPSYPWLAVSLSPLDTGRLQMSRSLLDRLGAWMARTRENLPPGLDISHLTAGARFKRVALHGWVKNGLSQGTYGELHLDGGAAFAAPFAPPTYDTEGHRLPAEVGVEALTVCLVALLRLVSCHAAENVGLAGDAVVSAQLLPPASGSILLVDRDPHHFPRQLGTVVPAGVERGEATVDISGLSNSWPDVLAASRDIRLKRTDVPFLG